MTKMNSSEVLPLPNKQECNFYNQLRIAVGQALNWDLSFALIRLGVFSLFYADSTASQNFHGFLPLLTDGFFRENSLIIRCYF